MVVVGRLSVAEVRAPTGAGPRHEIVLAQRGVVDARILTDARILAAMSSSPIDGWPARETDHGFCLARIERCRSFRELSGRSEVSIH